MDRYKGKVSLPIGARRHPLPKATLQGRDLLLHPLGGGDDSLGSDRSRTQSHW